MPSYAVRISQVAAVALLVLSIALPLYAEDPAPQPGGSDMEPLKLELPQPTFSGTPLTYESPILEITFKDRPPFMAPKGLKNVAAGKPVTSSDKKKPYMGKLEMITDGKKEAEEDNIVELRGGPQYVQIDLGAPQELFAILIWHFFAYDRVYHDVIVQLADDAEFTKNVRTIFNNDQDNSAKLGVGKDKEYVDKYEGRLFDAKGQKARYVRMYTNGNSTDDLNHYIEVEIFGRPVG